MSAATDEDERTLSAECALAQKAGYSDMHRECRQTKDIPLPHSVGILLAARCACRCHSFNRPR